MDNPYVAPQQMKDTEAEFGLSELREDEVTDTSVLRQEVPSYGREFADQMGGHVAISAALRGEDPVTVGTSTSAEIELGQSNMYKQEARLGGAAHAREMTAQALKVLSIPDLPESTYQQAREQYNKYRTVPSGDVAANTRSNLSAVEPEELPNQNDVLNERAKLFAEQAEAASSLDTLMDQYFASQDAGTARAVYEFYDMALLPETTAITQQLISHLSSKGWMDTSYTDYIAPGSNIKAMVEAGRKLPAQQKVQFFADFMEGIAQANSILGDKNNYTAYTIAESVKTHLQEGREVGTLDVVLNNLETAGLVPLVGTVAKGIVRIGNKAFTKSGVVSAMSTHPTAPIASVATSAPNNAPATMAAVINNPELATAAGTSPDEMLLSYGLPKYTDYDLQNAPASIVDAVNHARTYGQQSFDQTLYKGFLLNKQSEDEAISKALKESRAEASRVPDLHIHNQVHTKMEEGFTLSSMYGNGNVGFARKGEALDKAFGSGLFDVSSPNFEIVAHDLKTGKYTVVYNGAKDYGKSFVDTAKGKEYFIKTTAVRRYDDVFATAVDVDSAPKIGLVTKLLSNFSGKFTTVRSVESILPRDMAKAVTANFTAKVALQNNLKNITKNYDVLSDTSKSKVMHTVVEGANYQDATGQVVGKEFSYTELVSRGLSEKEIAGYFQLRELTRTTHAIRNRQLLEELERGGYRRFVSETDDFDTIGKEIGPDELDALLADVAEVYDVSTKTARKVTKQDLVELYGNNASLVKMKSAKRVGSAKYEYALVPDITHASRELPVTVLSDVAGYAGPRIYQENVFIEAIDESMTVNGRAIPKDDPRRVSVVAAAGTQQEADQILAAMSGGPGVSYRKRNGRELVNVMEGWELEDAAGSLYYSKRGQPLVGYNQRAARVIDPVRALEVNKNNVAKITHTDSLVAQLESSWVKTYGKYSRNGMFPGLRDDIITQSADAADAETIKKAQAMWDLIDMYKFSGEENVTYRRMMVDFADAIDRSRFGKTAIGKYAAEALYTSGREGQSAISRLKSATFAIAIAARPIRQLFLQAAQHAYLGSLDAKSFGKAYQQMSGIATYRTAYMMGRGDAWELGAKASGLSVREFKELYDGFQASGLLAQIDSHAAVSGTLRDPKASLWDGVNTKYFTDKAIDTIVPQYSSRLAFAVPALL